MRRPSAVYRRLPNAMSRRQALPGVEITQRALGGDQRLSIANRWRLT